MRVSVTGQQLVQSNHGVHIDLCKMAHRGGKAEKQAGRHIQEQVTAELYAICTCHCAELTILTAL